MKVIKNINMAEVYGDMSISIHYAQERNNRELVAESIGEGYIVDTFVVDKGHTNGLEVHQVTSTGLVLIFNRRTRKLVTKLVARPEQIMRYYFETNCVLPMSVLILAQEHEKLHYNQV